MVWEAIADVECSSIGSVAHTFSTDLDDAWSCVTQLHKKGIAVDAFVVNGSSAYFIQGVREEILTAMRPQQGSTMYLAKDPHAKVDLPGNRVVLVGLHTQELNGKTGTVLPLLNIVNDRLPVNLDASGKNMFIKLANLKKRCVF